MRNQESIRQALAAFSTVDVSDASLKLLETLGYTSEKRLDLPSDPEQFVTLVDSETIISKSNLLLDSWCAAHFLFQLTNDEIPGLARQQLSLIGPDSSYRKGVIESFVFLAIEIEDRDWSRTDLTKIVRELNRAFPMPVIVLFAYSGKVSVAIIDRRQNKREASKTVVDGRRISIIKDIDAANPHRAHLEILNDMCFVNLGDRSAPSSFRELYEAWMQVLSVQALNKKFYDELLTWFLWANKIAKFPKGQKPDYERDPADDAPQSVATIRLLTRLIFVWFVREKGIVPDELFDQRKLSRLLKEPPSSNPDASTYYKAILQNLFFATLNTEQQDRRWKTNGTGGVNSHYLVHSVYRYKPLFHEGEADNALGLFASVPFLNGGLFECLDREITTRDLEKNPKLAQLADREGNALVLRVDGFSERTSNALDVPNRLFFSEGEEVDLNSELGTKGKKRTARGLIDIFQRYKFTIEENTPIDEEVALDPELLGKVFENLLASYNEDTKTTARKLSGSFYTPRVVVDYMVDEALYAHFEAHLNGQGQSYDLDTRLRRLLAFGGSDHDFSPDEAAVIISAIENLHALDLACGSGAFLMGMLQKLVNVLHKLDPENTLWKQQNRAPLERQLKEAATIYDPRAREDRTVEASDALEKLEIAFSDKHYVDYSRKLYLIEKCLFGVDIQPIAVQIAKLRFFISLVVSQRSASGAENCNITALPNLETKVVAANSLIPIERPPQLTLRDPAIDDKESELKRANERHFAARTTRTKRKYREQISALRDELALVLQGDNLLSSEAALQIVQWDPFDQNGSAGFLDPEWMFGLTDGFDIVISNPPFVRQEKIKDAKPLFQKLYTSYIGTADLYTYFYERSIRLLKPGGVFAFITSNKWYRAAYGEGLRKWMKAFTTLRIVIDFNDKQVFEAITYPTIVVANRRAEAQLGQEPVNIIEALNWPRSLSIDELPTSILKYGYAVPQASLVSSSWQFEGKERRELLSMIQNTGEELGSWCGGNIYRGLLTGLNDAFVIDGATRSALITDDPTCETIIVPFLRGRDIKRWSTDRPDQWLLMVQSSENAIHPWSHLPEQEAEALFAKTYRSIHRRFSTYRNELIARQDQGKFYWELRSCAYWHTFVEPKIMCPDIADRPQFTYDTEGSYIGNTAYMLAGVAPWVLTVLNSSVICWYYAQISPQIQNGYFRFFTQYLSQIPIPAVTSEQVCVLMLITEMLLSDAASRPKWEWLANGLVYELFFPSEFDVPHKLSLFSLLDQLGLYLPADAEPAQVAALVQQAQTLSAIIFRNDHPIYRVLFDMQALPFVRIIEGKD